MGHPPPAWAPEQHLPGHARSPPREQPLRGGGLFLAILTMASGGRPCDGQLLCKALSRAPATPASAPPHPPLHRPRLPSPNLARLHHAPPPPPRPSIPRLAPPQTLKKDLAGAIIDPQTTGFCLEQILTTTFVNSMDGTSLAF